MKATLTSILFLFLFVVSREAMARDVDSFYREDMSLVISKGITIHRVDDPAFLPRSFREIEDDDRLFPVPAGTFMLLFNKVNPLQSSRGTRYLVVTQNGIWGYTQNKPSYIEGENRSRSIALSDKRFIIFRRDSIEEISGVSVRFGRGEIYEISPQDNSHASKINITLPDDKKGDIQNLMEKGQAIPNTASVQEDYTSILDPLAMLPVDVSFSNKPFSLREKRRIYHSWPSFRRINSADLKKPCGVQASEKKVLLVESGSEINAGFNADDWLGRYGVSFGLSARFARSFSSEITNMLNIPVDQQVLTKIWALLGGDLEDIHLIRQNGDCQRQGVRSYDFEFGVPGQLQKVVNPATLKRITENHPDIGYVLDPVNGLVFIKCYARDFLRLSEVFKDRLQLKDRESAFVFSNLIRVRDWESFFAC